MSSTDAQRRPVFIDRRNNRLFADPLIGNGAWPEVLVTPGMFGTFPANTILGRQGTSGTASAISADVTIDLLNTATTSVLAAARVTAATTSAAGVVQLNDAINSTSTTTAATANAVKTAYDLANAALPKSGGTLTGGITFAAGQATATTAAAGIVQLTDSFSSTSTTTAATPAAVKAAYDNSANKMPLSGGTFTGGVKFDGEATLSSLNGDCIAGLRNRIINGGMRICQRNASVSVFSLDATGVYTLDRWRAVNNTDGNFTISQSTDVPVDQGFTNSLLVTVGAADTSLAASQRASIQQRIEGYRVADFLYGSVSAKTVILSFWVKASATGSYGLSLRNAGSGATRSYNASYSVNAANTWEKKQIIISGDTTGTWATGSGIGLNVTWSLGSGSSCKGAAAWQAGDTDGVTTATAAPIGTASATLALTGVQLEVASQTATSATPFERRPLAVELMLCQRYYWKSYDQGVAPNAISSNGQFATVSNAAGLWRITVPFKVTMRDVPAVVNSYSPATGSAGAYRDDNAGLDRSTTLTSVGMDNATFAGSTAGYAYSRLHVTAEAEL